METNNKTFVITSLSKEDIKSLGYDISNLSDDDINKLCRNMEEQYMNNLFWESLDSWCEFLGYKKM